MYLPVTIKYIFLFSFGVSWLWGKCRLSLPAHWLISGWSTWEFRIAKAIMISHLCALDANSKHTSPDGGGETWYNWIQSIWKCWLTGCKVANTQRRDEFVSGALRLCFQAENPPAVPWCIWVWCEKQWLSLSGKGFRAAFVLSSGWSPERQSCQPWVK